MVGYFIAEPMNDGRERGERGGGGGQGRTLMMASTGMVVLTSGC